MEWLDKLPDVERTRIMVMLAAVFVSVIGVVIGLTVPFASVWVAQRMIHRREFKREVQKVFLDIIRQLSDYRTACANVALKKYFADSLFKTAESLGPPDPTDESVDDEDYEESEKIFQEASKIASEANDVSLEMLMKKHDVSTALTCSVQAVELLFDEKGKKVGEAIMALLDAPDVEVELDVKELAATISAAEKRINIPLIDRISVEMDALWKSVK